MADVNKVVQTVSLDIFNSPVVVHNLNSNELNRI